MAIKQWSYMVASVLLFCACHKAEAPEEPVDTSALVAACSYIQGGGSNTTGGKGGAIYVVSLMTDSIDPLEGKSVPGTLRYAVEQGDARIVVFQKSGIIHLQKPLTITKGNITIAGQSAPGTGVCIADYPLVIKDAENVIVRFLHFRMGEAGSEKENTEYDAISVNDSRNVVLDHLSCSWSVDECVSCYGNTNFTMQYCFITESLKNSIHGKGSHGYGGIWGGKNATFHHNLLAHHDSRNPRFDHDYVDTKYAGPIDFVNNVVYNWGGNSAYGGEGSTNGKGGRHINMVANFFKPGPSTSQSKTADKPVKVNERLVDPWTKCTNCTDVCGGSVAAPKIYLSGNKMTSSMTVTENNWSGSTRSKDIAGTDERWTQGLTLLMKEQSADEAFETVLTKAGCSLLRDAIDERIVNEVRNGNYTFEGSNGSTGGLIDTPSDVGGWPVYSGTKEIDSDYDGIPDAWEEKYGLNPKSYSDCRTQNLVSGYSNYEVYLNEIVAHLY